MSAYMHTRLYVCMCVCVYVCMYVRMYVCSMLYVCAYALCMHECIHTCPPVPARFTNEGARIRLIACAILCLNPMIVVC